MKISCQGQTPKYDNSVFIAEGAKIIGNVEIGTSSSIWFNAVVRGDVAPIKIGHKTNIQDNAVIHGTWNKAAAIIGNEVTIGHSAILHGCAIGDRCLIGMGAIIMDKAQIGEESIVGAGALVTEGSSFPPRSLILGRPAKVARPLTAEELAFLPRSAENYQTYVSWYK